MPDRTRLYRTQAVVLKHIDLGEADRLVTVFTPHLGKLRLVAKGVRKPTSRKAGHLESFVRTSLLIARGRNLDIITQAEMVEPYWELRRDLRRMSHAYYVGEVVDHFGEEQAENTALYELLCDALSWICTGDNLTLAMRYFELRALSICGYRPELFHCVRCAVALQPESNYFSNEEGGMLCPRCGEGTPAVRAVGLGAQKVLRYMLMHSFQDCVALKLKPATHSALESLLQDYLVYTLERQLKSVEFLSLLRVRDHSPQND
jgi:DNA repair protein RecO (recombination protein O)